MRWIDIPGFEAYAVSDEGLVRVHDRIVIGAGPTGRKLHRLRPGRVLRPSIDARGYKRVGLYQNHKYVTRLVHKLVAEAFCPNPNRYYIVMHLDGNPANCRADNLRYGSATENAEMVVAHGRRKLSVEQIRMIRASAATNVCLAKELGVSDVFISYIRNHKAYAHIF